MWQEILVLFLVILNCQFMLTRAAVILTSTVDGRQAACPGERVTYTCYVAQGDATGWTAPPVLVDTTLVVFIPAHPKILRCSDVTVVRCAEFNFQANLTHVGTIVNGIADMTSTFSFTARAGLNGTVVQCSDLTSHLIPPAVHTFTVAGLPSPPQTPSYIVKEYFEDNVTLVLNWHLPKYGGGALVNYTITVSPALISFTTSGTSIEVTVPYNVMHTVSIVATNCNGSSSAALETIRIVNCSDPTVPGNGSIETYQNTTEGAEILFGCNPQYSPPGRMRAVCAQDGRWNPDPGTLVCTVNCGAPSFASRVTVHPFNSTLVGSEVFYQCQLGPSPEERRTSLCGEDGKWNPDPTSLLCGVNCGIPRPPRNGTIVNYTGTLEGSALFYRCNFGFGPQGVLTAVCTANGNWIPDVICREMVTPVDCGPPVTPQNGFLESYTNTTEGSEVFYNCDQHMVLEGRMRAVCTRNGWSSNPADLSCIRGSTDSETVTSASFTSIAISVVISCAVSFVVAALVGAAVHCCAVSRKKTRTDRTKTSSTTQPEVLTATNPEYENVEVPVSQTLDVKPNPAYALPPAVSPRSRDVAYIQPNLAYELSVPNLS